MLVLGPPALAVAPPRLDFSLHARPLARRSLDALKAAHTSHTVRVFEPYEGREVEFLAFDFVAILDSVYAGAWRDQEELLFTCSDGYQPTVPVERFLEHRAWLAFERGDRKEFAIAKLESGATRRVSLAPFYLIWENLEDERVRQEGDYGWPYQLVGVDVIRTEERFARMMPPPGAASPVRAGFTAFRIHCSRCHAIDGEGGQIGPDLGRPVNPIDVRSRDWLRRWLDDPSQLVPNARMERLNPALPNRGRVIEEILDYLQAMADAKRGTATGESGSGG